MSFGAFGGRHDLMAHFDPRQPAPLVHAGTFNNNVLSMSAGIAGLTRVLTDERADRAERARRPAAAAAQRGRRRPRCHAAASGRGSLMTTTPQPSSHRLRYGTEPRAGTRQGTDLLRLLVAGQWTARRGMITLSLPITDEHCDAFVAAFDAIVEGHAPLLRRHLGPAARRRVPGGAGER